MKAQELIAAVKSSGFDKQYAELHWTGSFEDYLNFVLERPAIARNAFQRMYDMIASYGSTNFVEYKKDIVHWKFFDDPIENGRDAIFGLDVHLMKLVNTIKAGACGYGPEKRVILLHGPVGSSKSTIARLMKKGIEAYSKIPEGTMYTYTWINLAEVLKMEDVMHSPMNQDPLYLIPPERRDAVLELINKGRTRQDVVKLEGDLSPACRY
ncbi:MAG: serine protein kinase, partial [Proteobacteria bacterium]|nr:serine protein kinase [Pseudomonadota bacterium]